MLSISTSARAALLAARMLRTVAPQQRPQSSARPVAARAARRGDKASPGSAEAPAPSCAPPPVLGSKTAYAAWLGLQLRPGVRNAAQMHPATMDLDSTWTPGDETLWQPEGAWATAGRYAQEPGPVQATAWGAVPGVPARMVATAISSHSPTLNSCTPLKPNREEGELAAKRALPQGSRPRGRPRVNAAQLYNVALGRLFTEHACNLDMRTAKRFLLDERFWPGHVRPACQARAADHLAPIRHWQPALPKPRQ